jgi:arylsulfatase A-like enzyme
MQAYSWKAHLPALVAGVVGTAAADAWVTVHALDGESVSALTRLLTFAESLGILLFPMLVAAHVAAWLTARSGALALGPRLRAFAVHGNIPGGVVATVYVAVGAVGLAHAAMRARYVVSHLKPVGAAPSAVVVTVGVVACAIVVADRVVRFLALHTSAFWSRPLGVAVARASYLACTVVALLGLHDFLPNDGEPFLRLVACGALSAVVARELWLRAWPWRPSPRLATAGVLALMLASAAAYPALTHLPGRVRTMVAYRSPMGSIVLALVRSLDHHQALSPRAALAAEATRAEARTPPRDPKAGADKGKPNLVLLQLDTVRPDRVAFSGYSRAHTPALDRFRSGAVWFRSTYAPAPTTRYVMASIFTGADGERARAAHPADRLTLGARTRTLAEVLEDLGYDRVGVTVPHIMSQMAGYGRGFRVWESAWTIEHDDEPPRDTLDVSTADAILEHLDAAGRKDRPYFLLGHFWCAHAPYITHTGRAGDASTGYDAALEHCDAQVGRVLDAIDARPDAANTAVIVYSDHGEMLGEHGLTGHGTTLYEPAVRALLLARLPGVTTSAVDSPVSLVGIHALLAALAGGRPLTRDTEHLLELAHGREVAPHPVFATIDEQVRFVRFRGHAVIDGRYKYVRDTTTGSELLFDLESDPAEHTDEKRREPEKLTQLSRQLDDWLTDAGR